MKMMVFFRWVEDAGKTNVSTTCEELLGNLLKKEKVTTRLEEKVKK